MKKNRLYLIIAISGIAILAFALAGRSSSAGPEVLIEVKQVEFIVDITTSGSLEAKNSIEITGPQGIRNYRIWNLNIQDIIPEGTEVKKGQYVARLDPSELTGRVKDAQLSVETQQSKYTETKLDTALTMRQARDKIINLEYDVREKQLVVDQSQFEPPATIQKAEIELEKTKRGLIQEKENYEIKRQQNIEKMQQAAARLQDDKNELQGLLSLQKEFTILAPQDGMLIYERGWDGKPIKAGSQISAWDPTVATLPDLSKMLSKTYVNEVDIRKVKKGQPVEIGFDAFPDKNLKGKVIKVANVGQQQPNSDAKVFEVEIEVFGTDPVLKPGMTTSNKIITKSLDSALAIPLECLHSQYDSISYVFVKSAGGVSKQEVMLGEANAESANILLGLEEGDRIYLSSVTDMEDKEVNLLDEMNGKRSQKEEPDPKPEQNQKKQRKAWGGKKPQS
ncbi:MAG: efflux RND transporter periplasmic adaptor subunit [Bacteroidota bacterium]